ncbi:MAG TPA: ferredoxin--NADP reductase [Acidimicrobiia bacterium]|nr:ferredoxin--NADP reductase [Acidimicrobiia bacterium]
MSRDHGFHPLRVRRVVQETHDTASFVFDVPDDLRDAFAYEAGQFCTFRIPLGDDELLRCYSMSSSPDVDDEFMLTVKRVAGGRVSNWLLDEVAEGDELALTLPAGVFTLRDHPTPIVAFAGGSGITPVISVIKSALATTDRRVRLLYANRDARSVIFRGALDDLAAQHADRLEVVHHLDSDQGFVHSDLVRAFVGDDLGADFYLCGPGPFMDVVEDALEVGGVPSERIFVERFAFAASVRGEPPAPVAETVAVEPATDISSVESARSEPVTTETVTIVLAGRAHEVRYQSGETFLETARRAGLRAPFSCESGSCATCMARLEVGEAKMRVNNALMPDEVAEGWVLTCQGLPTSPTAKVVYES